MHLRVASRLQPSPLTWTTPTNLERCLKVHFVEQALNSSVALTKLFFHEYGRRVGMVPKSSLKEGKNNQMVEKRTRTTKTTQNQTEHSPQAESPPSCSLSSVLGETSETKTND